MEEKEIVLDGRKYRAYVAPDEQQGGYVVIGPPEGLVDELGLPEATATKLHNILYDRGILSYADACKPKVLQGVLQELYMLDIQTLLSKFNSFEKDSVPV